MNLLRALARTARSLLNRRLERELDAEIAFHLGRQIEQNLARGMTKDEARRAARLSMGHPDLIRDDCRGVWGLRLLDTLRQDVRHGIRSLRRSPGFTAGVTLTLALGIGATTALFSLIDSVLLRPLPVAAPSELADIYTTCRRGDPYCASSYPDFLDYRAQSRAFTDMAAFATVEVNISDAISVRPSRIGQALIVTGNYFTLLGVGAPIGRLIQPADDALGSPQPVAVVSHRLWMNDYGAAPDIVGRAIGLNGALFTIVGVAPDAFRGTRIAADPDVWLPMSMLAAGRAMPQDAPDPLITRGMRWIEGVIGRRRPGVTIEQARADLLAVSRALQEQDADARGGRSVTVEATRALTLPAPVAGDVVLFIALVLGGVGAALLVACCANVAGLLLARATARAREIAVRQALGAARGRLVRQLLTESVLLAGLGATVGLAIALVGFRLLSAYSLPGAISIATLDLGLNRRVLLFAIGLALGSSMLFGAVPAFRASRVESPLTSGARTTQRNRWGGRLGIGQPGLLAIQTAIAIVLLATGGLFLRSLANGLALDVGFPTRNLVVAAIDPSLERYSGVQTLQYLDGVRERLAARPEIRQVSTAVLPPLSAAGLGYFAEIDGYVPAPNEEIRVEMNIVGDGYFGTLGIPLAGGREFSTQDREGAPPVAIINETMARRYWNNRDPRGATFRIGSLGEMQVLAVARDVTRGLTGRPEPFVYVPIRQHAGLAARPLTLIAATEGPAGSMLATVRDALRAVDGRMPVREVTTLESRVAQLLMPQRLGTTLLSGLAMLTLVLVAAGIAGSVGYTVARRRKEVGVRMALGASSLQVVVLLTRGALVPVAVGLVVGLGIGLAVSGGVRRFLYGVSPGDPLSFAVASAILMTVAALAAYLPARQATRLSPTEVLRED